MRQLFKQIHLRPPLSKLDDFGAGGRQQQTRLQFVRAGDGGLPRLMLGCFSLNAFLR
mgnify:CR=1 FL=1